MLVVVVVVVVVVVFWGEGGGVIGSDEDFTCKIQWNIYITNTLGQIILSDYRAHS